MNGGRKLTVPFYITEDEINSFKTQDEAIKFCEEVGASVGRELAGEVINIRSDLFPVINKLVK